MILIDTGFWVALGSPDDFHHKAAVECVQAYADEGFITTWPVLTETAYLIAKRSGAGMSIRMLREVQSGASAIWQPPDDALLRMTALMQQYQNLPMDLADASLVVLAEELGHGRILSTDQRDFNAYRWKNRKPFKNLLLKA